MNMKSYFRGIAAGMIIAAVVMGVANPKTAKMSEAEIISEAKTLGMVESTTLTEHSENENKDVSINDTVSFNDTVKADVSNSEPLVSANDEGGTTVIIKEGGETETTVISGDASSEKSGEESAEEEAETSQGTENTEDTETIKEPESIDPMPDDEAGFTTTEESVEIRVIKGDSSVSVSRRMFEAGLVESAVEFNKFLCDNGYDKSIVVGTYQISYGLDYESMAKIITRRN